MIVTIRADITWEKVGEDFAGQSEKKIKRSIKDMTGAVDVDIIEINTWDEDDEDY